MSVKVDVTKEFDAIGVKKLTSKPSQDAADKLVHEYNIATIGESYWKKRRENAKKAIEKSLTDVQIGAIDKAVKNTIKARMGETIVVIDTENNTLQLTTKNGASFLDEAVLRTVLMRDQKLDATAVDALLEKARGNRAPSKSFEVVEK